MHTEWTVRALNAGKHVLCEKPFAVTAADAGRCFDAAEAASRLVIGQFDVGLDLTRRDELELIGTEGKVVVPDPWLCRTGRVELHSGAKADIWRLTRTARSGLARANTTLTALSWTPPPGRSQGHRAPLRPGGRGGAGGSDRDGAPGCSRRRRSRCTGRYRHRRHAWAGHRAGEGSPMTSSAGAYRRLRQPGAEIRLPRDPERRLRADRYFALPV
jgi:GFO/IDH/MocA oxidoreductase family protein